jgi:hypothetical protein
MISSWGCYFFKFLHCIFLPSSKFFSIIGNLYLSHYLTFSEKFSKWRPLLSEMASHYCGQKKRAGVFTLARKTRCVSIPQSTLAFCAILLSITLTSTHPHTWRMYRRDSHSGKGLLFGRTKRGPSFKYFKTWWFYPNSVKFDRHGT